MQGRNTPSWLRAIPPVTRNLLIINILIWLVELIPGFQSVMLRRLALHFWGGADFNPAQLVTYCFLHDPGSIIHIGFNMFTLWMFGRLMEQVWGSKRFFIFYFVCAIGAALVQELVWQFTWMHDLASANNMSVAQLNAVLQQQSAIDPVEVKNLLEATKNNLVCLGASGAIFGILLGFAFVFPNMPLYLFFIPIPIKAKYMVIGYAVLEFFLGVSGGGTVAHFAHLGGMLFALPMLLYWMKQGTLRGNRFF